MDAISMPEGTQAAFAEPTLCAAFQTTVRACGDAVALRTKGDATRITWRAYGDRVRRCAGGLAGRGVQPGDAVAILLINRPRVREAARARSAARPPGRARGRACRDRAGDRRRERQAVAGRAGQAPRGVLADEWLPGGDELTPTMKLKREPIAAKYADRIQALYA